MSLDAMGPLERSVYLRDAVNGLCAAIDAGDVEPGEREMLALALVVEQYAGPLAYDLLCQLASRCRNGRKVLATWTARVLMADWYRDGIGVRRCLTCLALAPCAKHMKSAQARDAVDPPAQRHAGRLRASRDLLRPRRRLGGTPDEQHQRQARSQTRR